LAETLTKKEHLLKKILSYIFLILSSFNFCYSQNEANNWFFGNQAGLEFNSGNATALNTGQLVTDEGCATISDPSGLLLFYTDGITVWNKNHQIMDNGFSLNGHISTSQSATIIQKPGSNNLYYIFTIDAEFGVKGFCYSIVDISANSGLGSVITKNVFIKSAVCEKISIVKHLNNVDFWVVIHGISNTFYSYLVNSLSISNTPITSNIGLSIPFVGSASQGIMKFSPDGSRLAVTSVGTQTVELFDFSNSNGIISNYKQILSGSQSSDNYYGIEFSPNGNLLYVSNVSSSDIKQFDITASNIASTEFILTGGSGDFLGALQLGPDQKIYAAINGRNHLGVIEHPNNIGVACNYQPNGINLNGGISNLGLPNIYVMNNLIPTYQVQNVCSNVNVTFSINTSLLLSSVTWDFGDGYSSNQVSPNHLYTTAGTYNVTLNANTSTNSIIKNFVITINTNTPIPLPTITSPQTFCIQQNATINAITISGQNIKWYDAATGGNLLSTTSSLINGQTYYASQTINNCESLRTPVLINIQNTPTPTGTANQTFCSTQNPTLTDILVNGTNLNWYNSNSSTTVIPSTTPLVYGITYYATQTINNCESVNRLAVTVILINTLNANDYTETVCDNLNDGYEIINLSNYNTNLISNTSNCTFEYYSSLTGATNQTNTDLISTISNYNLTTVNNTFFVRITSTNGCYQIVKLNISLVNKPVITVNDIVPICENKNITINAGSGFDSYIWSTGSTSQSITITHAGNYSVTVTKNYGTTTCSTTKNFTVVLSNIATITNIETQDWTDNENIITVNTSSNSYGNYEFSINGFNFQDSNVFTGLISGSYTVYVRDKNGCGVTEDEIFLLMYPKFFTPNSDGYNDTWSIKFSYIEPSLKVNIFDRYGKLLKILNNTNSWDGKYNEYELPSDDYWFIVTREDGKEYRGHFTLKR
jgi:gliding motility-associated-like protein